MGLEEGLCKTADKGGGEIRIGRLHEQGFQEGKAGSLHGGEYTEPFLLLYPEELQPPAQLGKGDGEAFIVGMDTAGALCPTAWAGLQLRAESGHEGAE